MRRITKAVLVSIGLLTVLSATNFDQKSFAISASPLKDIANHWAESAISGATMKGYVDGYPDGTFKPDGSVSRAEFIKMVASAIGKKVTPEESNLWYLPYVKSLQDDEILSQHFYTDDMGYPMVRSEMAMVSTKATDKKSDATIEDAVKIGLIGGIGAGELDAQGSTTRAQAVTIIERILAKRSGKDLLVDQDALDKIAIDTVGTNIERYWNIKLQAQFPLKEDYVNGVKLTVDKMVILDPAKGADQAYGYLVGASKVYGVDINDYYLVAIHVDMSVDGTGKGIMYPTEFINIHTTEEYSPIIVDEPYAFIKQNGGFHGDRQKEFSGWIIYGSPKANKKAQFDYNGRSVPIILKLGSNLITIAT